MLCGLQGACDKEFPHTILDTADDFNFGYNDVSYFWHLKRSILVNTV